ncbi:hypothetical protein [Brachyspira catarrhinii]|uniref:Uncharacterized protein n=1 Tax=Brachyspira catarrhinii TaxID=2528966 RepID=A0ABY2TM82_9SPIR|nr:hypothetical protein [Brachyspira catarrhinii]TKZ25246.1 hypothetical protein EZH24_12480 [Brachyspira catarrhinii]
MKKLFLFTTILCLILSTTIYPGIAFTGKYTCKDKPNSYYIIKRSTSKPNDEGLITYYDGDMDITMDGRIKSSFGSKIMTVYWTQGIVESFELVNATQFYTGDFKWVRKGPAQ